MASKMSAELSQTQLDAMESVRQDVYWTRPRCAYIFNTLIKRGLIQSRSYPEMEEAAKAKGTTWEHVSQYKLVAK